MQAVQHALGTSTLAHFRTGNVAVDMLIATLISSVVSLAFIHFGRVVEYISEYINRMFTNPSQGNTVTVEFTEHLGHYRGEYTDSVWHEKMLVEAVFYRLRNEPFGKCTSTIVEPRRFRGDPHRHTLDRLRSLLITPQHQGSIDYMGMHFNATLKRIQTDTDSSERITHQITIMSQEKSTREINDFIKECYDEYITVSYGHLEKPGKVDLKYLTPSATVPGVWKRYPYKTKKSFDDLFFPGKELLIEHLKVASSGEGKVVLLLHGPAGCGKTTLIKAIAQYLERSVVHLRLSSIATNEQLIDTLHTGEYICVKNNSPDCSEYVSEYIPMDGRVVVIEDVDADNIDVVKKRDNIENFEEESVQPDNTDPEKPSPVPAPPALKSPPAKEPNSTPSVKSMKWYLQKRGIPDDSLSLSGFLNALDGPMEMPGAVIVMSTNCPDKLDTAITRPNRVTRKMFFGNIETTEIEQMLAHHGVAHDELENAIPSGKYTPAKAEEIILEHKMRCQVEGRKKKVE